ncbi:MAG: polyphosphate kinase 2 [Pseudomonadota bacterium]
MAMPADEHNGSAALSKKRDKGPSNRSNGKSMYDLFDIDNPKLPQAIEDAALKDGDYPYDKPMKRDEYERELHDLQIELLKLQRHVIGTGARIVSLFEGRDTAGKGGSIQRFLQHLNTRHARSVALSKPSEVEQGQWYFQRYVTHLPTAGHMVLFDRSWYNRAGVERVMGFCTDEEHANFLREAPQFEGMLVREGIHLFKFYLQIGRATQLKRFHDRRHDPLKTWKLSPIDLKSIDKWDDYTRAQDEMFRFTHTTTCPWTIVRANDKKRARLEIIRTVLLAIDYEGKDTKVVGEADQKIIGSGLDFYREIKAD